MNDQNTMEIKTPVETSVDATVEMPAKTSIEMPIKKVTKDPKKQAAGRAGSAARKAKQESILKELQTAKKNLRKHEDQPVDHEKPSVPIPVSTPVSAPVNVSWYLIPALFAGGVVYYIYKKISEKKCEPQKTCSQAILKNDLNNRSYRYME